MFYKANRQTLWYLYKTDIDEPPFSDFPCGYQKMQRVKQNIGKTTRDYFEASFRTDIKQINHTIDVKNK